MTSRRTDLARDLRQRSGAVEEKIWTLLRSGRIDGHKFRRQHPIERYVTDFACIRLRLAIEIDGGIHDRDEVVTRDHVRQVDLEQMGWTVIRFTNDQALSDPGQIVAAVRTHAAALD